MQVLDSAVPGISTTMTSVSVEEDDLRQFLSELFSATGHYVYNGHAMVHNESSQTTAATGLRLHPKVDVYHPAGEAHSADQFADLLRLYKHCFANVRLVVDDIVTTGDSALVKATQHIVSHLASFLAPNDISNTTINPTSVSGTAAETSSTAQATGFPPPWLTTAVKPYVVHDAHVPTSIQLNFGKNDAG